MSKKVELLKEAKKLGLEVTEKNTIAQIEAVMASVPKSDEKKSNNKDKEIVAERKAEVAKAGKRSEKAREEAELKAEKESRKASHDTTPQSAEAEAHVKRGPKPVTRPKSERRGKKYRELAKKLEPGKAYPLDEAVKLASETSPAKFDASVEVHVVLGVDPRQADQNVRATVSLPHGTGKKVRVAAFVPSDDVDTAVKAGADVAGEEAIVKLLESEQLDFDVLVSTPQLMPKLGKFARLLGPRGLMPNPKSGTVATNVAKAVKEAKGGKVEYRVDKQAIVHLAIGKVSFGPDKLSDNAKAFFDSLQSVKPSTLKSIYIVSSYVTTTMGPGIKIEL